MISVPALIVVALLGSPVFLPAEQVHRRLNQSSDPLVILDARTDQQNGAYLPDSRQIDWRDFLEHDTTTFLNLWAFHRNGKISADRNRIQNQLSQLGLQIEDNIVVYGDAVHGFGEEGRIWWMLKFLGFPNVSILDGGIAAWRSKGFRISAKPAILIQPSKIVLPKVTTSSVRTTLTQLRQAMKTPKLVLLDTRTQSEFEGKTPYYSKRGGRIPGALHLFWKSLLRDDGTIRGEREIAQTLERFDISNESRIVAYCTGGVRSAFVQAVLTHYGYPNIGNYDGSWWEWSKDNRLPVELEKSVR